jgi:hypothetical protein
VKTLIKSGQKFFTEYTDPASVEKHLFIQKAYQFNNEK